MAFKALSNTATASLDVRAARIDATAPAGMHACMPCAMASIDSLPCWVLS
jgi:hypothetical protein